MQRRERGLVLGGGLGAAALAWAAWKLATSGRIRVSADVVVVPPYAAAGNPPWTYPRPAEAGSDIWAAGAGGPAPSGFLNGAIGGQ